MFTVNKNGNFITGVLNGEPFSVEFNKDTFAKMQAIEAGIETAEKMSDVTTLLDQLAPLMESNPNGGASTEFHKDIYLSNKGTYHLMVNGKATSVPMPEALVNRIKDSLDKGIDIQPIIKFWIRFLRNPKVRGVAAKWNTDFADRVFNYINMDFIDENYVTKLMEEKGYTEEVAEAMATVKQCQITKEGLLKTYKVSHEITKRYRLNDKGERESYDVYTPQVTGVDPITGLMLYADKPSFENEQRVFEPAVQRQNGEEFYCGETLGHVIRVGQVHKLKRGWESIDTNDHRSCVPGLHIGGLSYIRGYQSSGTETHNVFVDPAHIGAVPDDQSGAIRCIQYFVCDAFSGVNGSVYHSSTYGKLTDDQWAIEKAEILKKFGEYAAERAAEEAEFNDLA